MKAHKRLMASINAIQQNKSKEFLQQWLATQPASTRKGYARGKFELPNHIKEQYEIMARKP